MDKNVQEDKYNKREQTAQKVWSINKYSAALLPNLSG